MFKHSPKNFVKAFVFTLFSLVALLLSFNVIVDPYRAFSVVEIEGLNSIKPEVTNTLRLAKPISVCRMKPNAIILGSSRAELALDPEHPAFSQSNYHMYNMAMAGTGIYEIYRTLQHTYYASNKSLQLAIIALDLFMFNAEREATVFGTEVFDYDEKRLILSPEGSCVDSYLFDFDRLFLAKAFVASISTLRNQDYKEVYLENGYRHPYKNALHRSMKNVGHRLAFINNEKYYMKKIWTAGKEKRFCTHFPDNSSTFDTLQKIISFARENNIELRFFLSPSHARELMALKESGLWTTVEEVKRNIVKVLAEDQIKNPGSPIPLWDFTTINSISMEPVPALEDKTAEMKWYWEMSHYKTPLGNMVIDRIMGYSDPSRPIPADLGFLLNSENIESSLSELLIASVQYEKKFPGDMQEIRLSAQETFEKRYGVACTAAFQTFKKGAKLHEAGKADLALVEFERARKLLASETLEAKKRHIPFREQGLMTLLDRAKEGNVDNTSFSSWIACQDRANKRKSEGDLKGAISDYNEAIDRGPTNTALHFLRGITYAEFNDHSKAIIDFKIGLSHEPNNETLKGLLLKSENALKQLAEKSLVAAKNPEASKTAVLESPKKVLVDWVAFQNSANLKKSKGNLKAAIIDYSKAIEYSPPNTALFYLRGITYAELRQHQDAIKDFEAGLKLEPSNESLKVLLKQSRQKSEIDKNS